MTSSTRPYFSYSFSQLEAVFLEKKTDSAVLRKLLDELSHRRTPKARSLKQQIERQITSLGIPVEAAPQAVVSRQPVAPQATVSKSNPSMQANHPAQASPSMPAAPSRLPPRLQDGPATVNRVRDVRPRSSSAPALSSIASPAAPPLTGPPNSIPAVLAAWTAFEVLSPPSFLRREDLSAGDRQAVADISGLFPPWERGERSKRNCRLYYQIVLGSVKLESAMMSLIEKYGDTPPERPSARGHSILATVTVDKTGRLVDLSPVAVSSFAWGVVTALRGQLRDLASWPQAEPLLRQQLEQYIRSLCEIEQPGEVEKTLRPLTRDDLHDAYRFLQNALNLPAELSVPPTFAIRQYVYFKDLNPPTPLLMNSFYLNDLALVRQLDAAGNVPANLVRYLGHLKPVARLDLLQNRQALEDAVAPGMSPPARWPTANGRSLVLLQQAAVNLAFSETRDGGCLGVNGPPGTGKTTLLRDIVAGVVTNRATAMVQYEDPEMAFEHSGEKIKAGNAWIHLYRVAPSLRGHEILVASSNNKAVENISAELPSLAAVADSGLQVTYLKSLSDHVHQRETWGLIAAVLGNAANRAKFKREFWWNEDFGLNTYLAAASANARQVEEKDSKTGETVLRTPQIVELESPPKSHEEALTRWQSVRQRFAEAQARCKRWADTISQVCNDLRTFAEFDARIATLTSRGRSLAMQRREATEKLAEASENSRKWDDELREAELRLRDIELRKPGILSQLFGTSAWREWQSSLRGTSDRISDVRRNQTVIRETLSRLTAEIATVSAAASKCDGEVAAATREKSAAEKRTREAREEYGAVFVDDSFWARTHEERQLTTPWLPPAAQVARGELFAAAVEVHRAFMDAAAKPLRHNLGALMTVFSGGSFPTAAKRSLLPDLWASLFLVTPVVSTTFASVERMIGELPPESLGWLIVDEAGQALPQAVVGALLRTKKAVCVGDPAQIEPVVVLPDTLTHSICRQFAVDPDRYAAPAASVQTLADVASSYASEFQMRTGSRSVGVPLLVHRRCSEPMFGVSNSIAYSGLMVNAKPPKESRIREVLGPAKWIEIAGTADDKWCRAEGDRVIALLQSLAAAGVSLDLYIVTPFVIVANQLRDSVKQSGVLRGWPDVDESRWLRDRIGTVHTVQGREAEAVIFILGAPLPAQVGARNWAGGRPNLLNVAVTRAKEVVYVIGNRELWRNAGVFGDLDARLGHNLDQVTY